VLLSFALHALEGTLMSETDLAADRKKSERLGSGFNRLWTAAIASNLADGLGRTAVPLIATTLTRDPLLIAGVSALAFVPWLLFGVAAGVIVDRVDRRIAMAAANAVRVLAAAGIAAAIATDSLTIWLLYVCILVFGIGETVYDNATTAIVPSIVEKRGLEKANSRMQAAEMVVQNFIATPVAGLLFAVAIAIPVLFTAAGFFVAAALALTLPLAAGRALRDPSLPERNKSARGDAKEAAVFLFRHRFLRSMVLLTSATGSLLALAQASSVLFFLDTLDVPVAAIGFVTAGIGAGALVGALTASAAVRRFGRGMVMFVACLFAGLGLVITGVSPNIYIAVAAYAFGAYGVATWNVPWGALRQDIVPGHLLGRVTGLNRTLVWGLFPVAGLLGGLLGRIDLRLPFVLGGALIMVVTLVGARLLLSASKRV
jgi:MFS family permease